MEQRLRATTGSFLVASLVREGIRDLERGTESKESLPVSGSARRGFTAGLA